jgi:hypothetical protein
MLQKRLELNLAYQCHQPGLLQNPSLLLESTHVGLLRQRLVVPVIVPEGVAPSCSPFDTSIVSRVQCTVGDKCTMGDKGGGKVDY